ncbi:MAG TPA: alpha/beta hydrolase [Sphingobium sp.]|uniref:alpha/beta fold hydrolase n=1 Tax=Sphingobium sp. TaxID=1912891 RepID=UPI002ED534B4
MSGTMNFAFLHGGGQGDWVWQETIAALRLQAPSTIGACLGLNAPGCGDKRGRASEDLSIEDVARELVADIEAAGLTDVILVGHSQAGQAIPFMAQMRPDLFRRLVYVTCSLPLPGQTVMQMIGTGVQGANDAEVGWPCDPRTTPAEERYRMMFCNDMDDVEATDFLGRVGGDNWPARTYAATDWQFGNLGAVPATFVLCLRDLSLPLAWQERFADRLKVEHRVALDAGHQAMNSRPHALAEILRFEAARR